jgi:hypothetical protein
VFTSVDISRHDGHMRRWGGGQGETESHLEKGRESTCPMDRGGHELSIPYEYYCKHFNATATQSANVTKRPVVALFLKEE